MSDQTLVLWHNPDCSKSRAAFELLRARSIAFRVRDYLQQPPNESELRRLMACEGLRANELLREAAACAIEGSSAAMDDEHLVQTLLNEPERLQRPILVRGQSARIGRPPERVLELL